jgi:hypothetical protein
MSCTVRDDHSNWMTQNYFIPSVRQTLEPILAND